MSLNEFAWVYVAIACMYESECLRVCEWLFICVYGCPSVYVFDMCVCACIWVFVFVCVGGWLHMYVFVTACVCVCVRHVWVCVHKIKYLENCLFILFLLLMMGEKRKSLFKWRLNWRQWTSFKFWAQFLFYSVFVKLVSLSVHSFEENKQSFHLLEGSV